MSKEPCAQCEEHARLHSGNWLGIGRRERCIPCEQHAELHSRGK